jgi:hypothetical protein
MEFPLYIGSTKAEHAIEYTFSKHVQDVQEPKEIQLRSEPSSTGYGSGCTTQAPRFKSPRMRIWVLIINLKNSLWGSPPPLSFQKKEIQFGQNSK